MAGDLEHVSAGVSGPVRRAVAVTPSDGADLAGGAPTFLYVGGGGDLTVILYKDSAEVLFKNVAAGTLLPVAAKRVKATGTTATYILACYTSN